jgi:DNA-binding MarR family transcriptional regulator
LVRALVEAHDAFIRADEAQIRGYGLAHGEFDCLVTLGEEARPLRMSDLAQRSLLTRSHATQIVRQLEVRGLVRRWRRPESEREVLVCLATAGEELFERVYPAHYRHLQRELGSRLSEEEQETLTLLLRKLADGGR